MATRAQSVQSEGLPLQLPVEPMTTAIWAQNFASLQWIPKKGQNPGDFLEVTKKRSVSVTYDLIESNRGGIFEGSSRIIFQICLGATLRTWAMLMIEAQTSSG